MLAIENGEGDDDYEPSVAGDQAIGDDDDNPDEENMNADDESASVATTQPEQTPDDISPERPTVPSALPPGTTFEEP